MDLPIPTVVNKDLSMFYTLEDDAPSPERLCETRQMFADALMGLDVLKRRIIYLLMLGFEPRRIAEYLNTNEMAVTRAKRSFLINLEASGMEV